ncbi:MAG: HNH endonuclease [Alphaproteobacteria bacterium]|nr:HNH endonuclease [Alphaproteobacteria bacterium]
MSLLKTVLDRVQGKAEKGQKRSSKWGKVRKQHLKDHPKCAVCESTKKCEVHHKIPFSLAPDLELDPKNLITLCENKRYGLNCHLCIGHLGNYKKFNDDVDIDTFTWNKKIKG